MSDNGDLIIILIIKGYGIKMIYNDYAVLDGDGLCCENKIERFK